MPYQYEDLLRKKAQQFSDKIQSELSYEADIDPDSLREYSVALQLGEVGKVTVFYSPKKKSFKLVTNHIDKGIAEMVTTIWNEMQGTASAVSLFADETAPESKTNAGNEKHLRAKAEELIADFKRNLSLTAILDDNSFTAYSVALLVDSGMLTIYYSPNRDSYSLKIEKLDKRLRTQIQTLWDEKQAVEGNKYIQEHALADYQAFVDGSFNTETKTIGFGAVILKNGETLARLSGKVEKFPESAQIAGELSATMRVIKWCKRNKVAEIDIFYDYQGIKKWATREWKPRKGIAIMYANFMGTSPVNIHWHKVKSHTGVHWNEVADELAKKGTLS